jgi:hypothetical protein
MQIQFSTTENCASHLFGNGLRFETPPSTDPPDNTGGGGSEEEEEEDPPAEGN